MPVAVISTTTRTTKKTDSSVDDASQYFVLKITGELNFSLHHQYISEKLHTAVLVAISIPSSVQSEMENYVFNISIKHT